jgi:sugar/nucleoside kinase (ribokinase family)
VADSRIITYGDVIDDVVAIPDGPIRDDTDTPSSIHSRPGGSAANTAAWLGSLGADAVFVGSVSSADTARHTEALAAVGAAADLHGSPDLPTGTIVVIVEGQRRAMLTERGANTLLDPAWVTDDLLAGAAVLHITGHALLNDAGAPGIAALIGRARAAGVTVSVAPGSAGFIADYGPERFLGAMAGADILFPSLDEGRLLTGLDSPEDVAGALEFPTVVLTLGAAGVIVRHPGGSTGVHAVVVPVVDPTGAGDAFCAGYLDAWVRTGDPVESARAGALVASRAVGVIGGRPRP